MEYSLAKFQKRLPPMRDGVRLAGNIYRPARDGALVLLCFPVILCRPNYDPSAQGNIDCAGQ